MHFLVVGVANLADVLLDQPIQLPAFLMPENHAGRFVLEMEQIQLAPQFPMVPFLCFLQTMQVVLESFLILPSGSVDPLQHFVVRIAAPVRAGNLHQFDRLDPPGIGDVRTTTKVYELALPIERDRFITRNRGNDLGLVGLTQPSKIFHGLIARHHATRDGDPICRQLSHLLFNRREIFGGKRPFEGEIVIEAIFDDRTDRDLRRGKQFLHGMRQQVRGAVANDLEPFGIFSGQDLQ